MDRVELKNQEQTGILGRQIADQRIYNHTCDRLKFWRKLSTVQALGRASRRLVD